MSQYLSRFYCGNKDGLCNFVEPINYEKMIDRQFDNLITEVVNQCEGEGKEKGYCCSKTPENMKTMDDKDMEHINKIAKGKIFKKDQDDKFYPGQIPLVKPNVVKGKIESIDMCNCGGDTNEYNSCVEKNCKDYKLATKYEYCKLGDMSSQYGCYGKGQDNCKVGPLDPDAGMMYSKRVRINNLLPDCYLNVCNKRMINGSLENTANFSPETQYYAYRNDTKSKYTDSIDNYLLLDKYENQTIVNEDKLVNNELNTNDKNFSIETILKN